MHVGRNDQPYPTNRSLFTQRIGVLLGRLVISWVTLKLVGIFLRHFGYFGRSCDIRKKFWLLCEKLGYFGRSWDTF